MFGIFGSIFSGKEEFEAKQIENAQFELSDYDEIKDFFRSEFNYFWNKPKDNIYTLANKDYVQNTLYKTTNEMLEHLYQTYKVDVWRKEIADCENRAERFKSRINDSFMAHNRFRDDLGGLSVFEAIIYWGDKSTVPHAVGFVLFDDLTYEFVEIKKRKIVKYKFPKKTKVRYITFE